jgi:hypothetical protein
MKKNLVSQSGFFNYRVIVGFAFCAIGVVFGFGAFPRLLALAQDPGQDQAPTAKALHGVKADMHITRSGDDLSRVVGSTYEQRSGEAAESAVAFPFRAMAPTRSSFMATWDTASGAGGYQLDVSKSKSFSSYVNGYQGLDVGNVTSRIVSGLSPGTTYYYRVRSYDAAGAMSNSDIMSATTITAPGLVIIPTFDSSILNDPNAAAIQSVINQAIATYQSLFRDSVTVPIYYRYTNTDPFNGNVLGTGTVAQSYGGITNVPWDTFINALRADARTGNDTTANATLPTGPLTANMVFKTANGRAVGLNSPPALVFNGGAYDGIVTLNPTASIQFTRPPSNNNHDGLSATQHEMDEVLGLGSYLDQTDMMLRPQDLFSWAAPGSRNITTSGSRYFSIDGGNTNIVGFNQDPGGDRGDWLSEGCPQTHPYVQNAFGCKGQFADVAASSPEGINLDVIGYDLGTSNGTPTPTPPPGPTALGNISTRVRVETGNNVLIGGFIVTGTQPKTVIVRAIGPSLPFGGTLSDTVLELHDGSGALIAFDDDWRTGGQEAAIIATGIPPSNDLESAIVVTLPANNAGYTAIVSGFDNATGIGVVEAYDLDRTVDSKLANISTRGFVSTGDNVMIAGTIIVGSNSAGVIVRALGPSLLASIPDAMHDTTLELRDSNGGLVAFNDDWRTDQEAAIMATGIPPPNDLESAIVASLPGNNASYTAIVRGYQNSEGVALVEVYQLQ